MSNSPARPADVRAFLAAHLHEVGTRGRFSADQVEAYNTAHPRAKYVPRAFVETVPVKVPTKDSRGRNRTKVVQVDQKVARAYLLAEGITTAKRGRIPTEHLVAYALTTI